MSDIEYIISPKSIAVVGASNRPGSLGLNIFRNLLDAGYQGILYPVNPKARSIQGVKAYPSLLHIPDEVDMAELIVPSEHVPSVIQEAGQNRRFYCRVVYTRIHGQHWSGL